MSEEIDRSNSAVVFHTFPDGLRCYARPRGQMATIALGLFGMGLSLLPLAGVSHEVRHLQMGRFAGEDVLTVFLMASPFLLAAVVFVQFMRVLRRPRGLEIKDGIVKLSTPDSPIARHEFQRANLAGAKLIQKLEGADLQILRRRSVTIVVLRNYPPGQLARVVDAVNDLVVDDHHWAFEVILLDKTQPQHPPNS